MKRDVYFSLIILLITFSGCEKYDAPRITSPIVDDIEINQTVDIGFEIFTDAGYQSSDVTAEKGIAVIKTDIGKEAIQGIIYITYTASSELGKDTITFTIKDNIDKTVSSKIEINVIDAN